MNPLKDERDPDIRGSWPAMVRAAKRARKEAIAAGTPFYVVQDGRLVNLNPRKRKKARRK